MATAAVVAAQAVVTADGFLVEMVVNGTATVVTEATASQGATISTNTASPASVPAGDKDAGAGSSATTVAVAVVFVVMLLLALGGVGIHCRWGLPTCRGEVVHKRGERPMQLRSVRRSNPDHDGQHEASITYDEIERPGAAGDAQHAAVDDALTFASQGGVAAVAGADGSSCTVV